MQTTIDLELFTIYLPDGDRRSYLIYGDFRNIFHVEFQADAAKKIRKIVKELALSPQPTIYYEGFTLGITAKQADTAILVLKEIKKLMDLDDKVVYENWDNHFKTMASWQMPKRQRWKIGDIFSIKLKNDTYGFGQVIGDYPTVALFDMNSVFEVILPSELEDKGIVTVLHVTPDYLNNWSWKVLQNYRLLASKDEGPTGSDAFLIGNRSFSASALNAIGNYYWLGIMSWTNENNLKELLMIK